MIVCNKFVGDKTIIVKIYSTGRMHKIVLDYYETDIENLKEAIKKAGLRNVGDFKVYNITFNTMWITEYTNGISYETRKDIIALSYPEVLMICDEYCRRDDE